METFGSIINWALFWLPRLAVISLVLTALVWLLSQTVNWFAPQSGDPVPEFEVVGTGADKALLARLLNAEFVRIKADLASGADAVTRQLAQWDQEFQRSASRREQSWTQTREALSTVTDSAQVPVSVAPAGVDLERVREATKRLQFLSDAIKPANVPDIKIASVELGPVLRWLVELFRKPSTNKVVIFDSSAAALIEGPIIKDSPAILQFEPLTSGTRTAQQTVEPIAYHILSSKLGSAEPKLDFGGWTAIRDFVGGAKGLAKLVSDPQPDATDAAAWREQMIAAAKRIESAGVAAREWQFLKLASFLFERGENFDNAIRVLDRFGELPNRDTEAERQARLAYLREQRVEARISAALKEGKGGGAVFSAAAEALAKLPGMAATQKLHRLGGAPSPATVKVALVGSGNPPWLGLKGPPDVVPLEDHLEIYSAQLAQIMRALAPSAEIEFVRVATDQFGNVKGPELITAFQKAVESGPPIIVLPFGPLTDVNWLPAFDAALQAGRLVIAPAGNAGVEEPPSEKVAKTLLAKKILLAESIDPGGSYSSFSSRVPGALAAVGSDLPSVTLTETWPTVVLGSGTGLAAATLAAVAIETVARQPALGGAALRDALLKAGRVAPSGQPTVARVAIPR